MQGNDSHLNRGSFAKYTRQWSWCQRITSNVLFFWEVTGQQELMKPMKGISNFCRHIYKVLYSDLNSKHYLVFKAPQCFWQFFHSYDMCYHIALFHFPVGQSTDAYSNLAMPLLYCSYTKVSPWLLYLNPNTVTCLPHHSCCKWLIYCLQFPLLVLTSCLAKELHVFCSIIKHIFILKTLSMAIYFFFFWELLTFQILSPFFFLFCLFPTVLQHSC